MNKKAGNMFRGVVLHTTLVILACLISLGRAHAQVICLDMPATIVGTDSRDGIRGTPGDDVIAGLGGNDVINGGGGDDLICGGQGDDKLNGGPGGDMLEGGEGDDMLTGAAGFVFLDGASGNDKLNGGPGGDMLKGGEGDDMLAGAAGNDILDGASGNDKLNGGPGGGDTCTAGEQNTGCENVEQPGSIDVSGRVVFDTGEAVEGAMVSGSVVPQSVAAAVRAAYVAAQPDYSTKPPRPPRSVPAALSLSAAETSGTTTDANGNFTLTVGPVLLPVEVLVEVSFQSGSDPAVESARWRDTQSNTLDVGTIIIPNPLGAEIPLAGGAGQSTDGSVRVEGVPAEVDRLFARAYDPDAMPDAFPGEFAEMGAIPLNSSVFVWVEALDASGNPVDSLSQAATMRARISRSQWNDLEDINAGTDRIDIPIYSYNESTDMWEQEGVGWVEDGVGTVLPEDAQSVILDGTFAGELFATLITTHFSFLNVDYAFIGPWTLSRLDPARRNVDCLFNALQLAKTIALSQQGRAAYAKVNQPGADLGMELSDANGPELKNSSDADLRTPDGEKVWGQYTGDSGGSETQFEMNNDIWDGCAGGATEEQKKNTTLRMTVNILHETAHWKDDVKKFPNDDTDTPGEEGTQLERDLFGGNLDQDGAGNPTRDGSPLDAATRDGFLNPVSWPPPPPGANLAVGIVPVPLQAPSSLEVTIALPQSDFELGEEIPVEVTYKNISPSPIQVMNRVVLEGHPLYFNIANQTTGERVAFLGQERELQLTDSDFTSLQPNETLVLTVNLLRDPISSAPRYQLLNSGMYEITAVYEATRGVGEATSNTRRVTIGAGGSISGIVTDATNGQAVTVATVKAMQGGSVLDTATTNASGNYTFPALPAGTYTLEARASGFLRSTQENVQVITGQDTVANLSLSPLITGDDIRIVLTWGASPSDLDSHLWLPTESPYHVAFSRPGDSDDCPFAELDQDDTSAFGPETITISQRFLQGSYLYAVHNFSGSPDLAASQAQVQVFDSSGLIATFNVPAVGTGVWWKVLSIDGATGALTELNELGDDPAPYPDTDVGCGAPN